jgi:hypothetical protein
MSITANEVADAVRRWALETRSELSGLAREVRSFARLVAQQWRTDKASRSAILSAVAHGLGAAALRGPRATLLWAAGLIGHMVTVLARFFDGSLAPATAR